MTPKHYHTPPQSGTVKVLCPVCKETVYSRAGIHPQCAVRQSDPPKPKNKPPVPGASAALPAEIVLVSEAEIATP